MTMDEWWSMGDMMGGADMMGGSQGSCPPPPRGRPHRGTGMNRRHDSQFDSAQSAGVQYWSVYRCDLTRSQAYGVR